MAGPAATFDGTPWGNYGHRDAPRVRPAANDFPCYSGADVKIIISGVRQYELHSAMLKANSSLMADVLLIDANAAPLDRQTMKKGVTIKFRLDLKKNPEYNWEAEKGLKYILKVVKLTKEGKVEDPQANQVSFVLDGGKAVDPTIPAYDAVLGAFYQKPIDLGDSKIEDMLQTAIEIADVAKYLDCIHIITSPIEAALLAKGHELWVAISLAPVKWLRFGTTIHSKTIVKEAMCHVAGRYFTDVTQSQITVLDAATAEVLRQKAENLKETVKRCFKQALTWYPQVLQRVVTVSRADQDDIGRNSYANQIYDWLCLVILRHWLTQQVSDDQTHNAPDLGQSVVEVILEGGEAYLSRVQLSQWHSFFPMTEKGDRVIEGKLAVYKEQVKSKFRPLAHNASHLRCGGGDGFPYFTCVTVGDGDFVWERDWEDDETMTGE